MQGASPLVSPGLGGARRGLNLRNRHPAGASPRRWWLDQPLRCLTGACPAGCLLTLPLVYFVSPIPPPPFPSGEGGDFRLFYARGFAPCIPGAGRGAARVEPAEQAPDGGIPPALVARPAVAVSGGGLAGRGACLPCRLFAFFPPSPCPLPGGKGETISLFRRGLRPRHPGTYLLTALTDHAEQAPSAGEPKV